jgi:uncharacterized OsmC-like protein
MANPGDTTKPRLPHQFRVELSSDGGEQGVLTAPGRPPITGGSPSEFGGRDDRWSPEHLLIAATVLCTMSTFHALASRESLALARCHCQAEGTVAKTAAGLAFTEIRLHVALTVAPADAERAAAVLERAKRHCLVSASLKCPVTIDSTIDVA